MRNGIKYKDLTAMPGSELHRLLTEAADAKDPKKAKELRDKAEKSYKDTEEKYRKLTGL